MPVEDDEVFLGIVQEILDCPTCSPIFGGITKELYVRNFSEYQRMISEGVVRGMIGATDYLQKMTTARVLHAEHTKSTERRPGGDSPEQHTHEGTTGSTSTQ